MGAALMAAALLGAALMAAALMGAALIEVSTKRTNPARNWDFDQRGGW
jgi:hypothetical protein